MFMPWKCWQLAVIASLFALGNAIYEPSSNSGIKTRTYHREPDYNQQQQQQHYGQYAQVHYASPVKTKTTTTTVTTSLSGSNDDEVAAINRLSANTAAYNQNNAAYEQQRHYVGGQTAATANHYQNAQSRYERLPASSSTYDSAAGSWEHSANAISQSHDECPAGHTGPLPYGYDCRRFLNCWHGRGHVQSCGPGTYFNHRTLECDSPDKVDCGALGATSQQQQQNLQYNENRFGRLLEAAAEQHAEHVQVLCPQGVQGLHPHPTDCTKFLNCANGNVHVQNCGPGTAYDALRMLCDYKDKVNCGNRAYGGATAAAQTAHVETQISETITIMCPDGVTGMFAYPFDYTVFLNCKNGKTALQNCVPDTAFSISLGVCLPKQSVEIMDRVEYIVSIVNYEYAHMLDVCPPNTDGAHLYPFDARKFVQCQHEEMQIVECPSQTVFSLSHRLCLPQREIKRSDRVGFWSEITSSRYQQQQFAQMSAYEYMMNCPKGAVGPYPYPFDQSKYIVCNYGLLMIEECPQGNAFSLSQKSCQSKEDVRSKDRVQYYADLEQWNSGEAKYLGCPPKGNGSYLFPFDCTKYYKCNRGQTIIEACPAGQVYSINRKGCIVTDQVEAYDRVDYYSDTQHELSGDYNWQGSKAASGTYGKSDSSSVSCPVGFGGKYAHPYDNAKYLICSAGILLKIETCPQFMVFNKNQQYCGFVQSRVQYARNEAQNHQSQANINQNAQTQYGRNEANVQQTHRNIYQHAQDVSDRGERIFCPTGLTGYYAHPFVNFKYFSCREGKTLIEQCEAGSKFSLSQNQCLNEAQVASNDCVEYVREYVLEFETTKTQYSNFQFLQCPASANGKFIYPFDCSRYVKCDNGLTSIGICGAGYFFHKTQKQCMPRNQVSRQERVDFYWDIVHGAINCPPGVKGLHQHPYEWTKYLNCVNGKTIIQDCPQDTVFSLSKKRCEIEQKVPNHDRCNNGVYLEYDQGGRADFANGYNALDQYAQSQLETQYVRNGYSYNSQPEVVCPTKLSGLYLHPFSPEHYVICQNGQTRVEACNRGSVFSISKRMCGDEAHVAVNDRVEISSALQLAPSTTSIECPAQYSGTYIYPFDCSKYLKCEHGQTTVEQCGNNMVFSKSIRVCVSKDQVENSDRVGFFYEYTYGVITCPPNVQGYYQHPYEWTKYLNCENGRTYIEDCPPSKVFSVSRKYCEAEQRVPATDRCNNGVYKEFEQEHSIAAYSAASDVINNSSPLELCSPGKSGIQAHPHDCTKFVNCDNGKANIQDCSPGTAWSKQMEVCDFKQNVDCSDRQTFAKSISSDAQAAKVVCSKDATGLEPHPYDCTKFLNCANGVAHIQDCGPGTAWNIQMEVCDYIANVDCSTRNSSASYDRQGKSFSNTGSYNQATSTYDGKNDWQAKEVTSRSHIATDNSQTNRWSNMNVARPAATTSWSQSQQHHSSNYGHSERTDTQENWSGSGSRVYQQTPEKTVIVEEGSLQPNSNYQPVESSHSQVYSVPLAPMKPIPDSPSTDYSNRWRPMPSQNSNKPPLPSMGLLPPHHATNSQKYPSGIGSRANSAAAGEYPTQQVYPDDPLLDNDEDTLSYDQHASSSSVNSFNLPRDLMPPPAPAPLAPTPADSSNLYGGLQPPLPSTNMPSSTPRSYLDTPPPPPTEPFMRIPPPSQPTFNENAHYSPSYASVALAHKGSTNSRDSTSSTTERRGLMPPAYNKQYYKSSTNAKAETIEDDDMSALPIGDAIRQLLRPYFNRSGTIDEQSAAQAESHIMNLAAPSSENSTARLKAPSNNRHEPDAELILTGEQHHLVTMPTQTAIQIDETDFYANKENLHKHETRNWQEHKHHTHSVDFHAKHPHLPNPFKTETASNKNAINFMHNQTRHGHSQHHHGFGGQPHQHSREFHLRNPQLPNPFANSQVESFNPALTTSATTTSSSTASTSSTTSTLYDAQDQGQQVEQFQPTIKTDSSSTTARTNANKNTVIGIDIRSSDMSQFDNEFCQFNCGNGKCIKYAEVCNGVNNCGNRRDESNCDHLGYEVRLAGGETPNMGRIEVKVLGKWGMVCDDKFGLNDANVVCRELGYDLGAMEVRGNSVFAPKNAKIIYAMDEVECRGNETALKDCQFNGWGVNKCGPDEVVGVICKVQELKCPQNYWLCSTSMECIPPAFVCDNTPDCADKSDESDGICKSPIAYRLTGGKAANEGRLEVKYHGTWGTVCDDDFGLKEAQVACNSLGYYGKPEIMKGVYGEGNGIIWLNQIHCVGNESSLDQCAHWHWGEHNCNHNEDLGLHCTTGPRPQQSTRLKSVKELQTQQEILEEGQQELEDIGLYSGKWERSSKSLQNQRRCGQFKQDLFDEYLHPEERVVNGSIAKRGRHPWQATIRNKGRAGVTSHWCGAVLISKRHLLTAAHCLAGYPKGAYFVRMGDHYANIAESSEVDSFIESWYIHEKFREQSHMNNDIALVVLKTPVRFNDYVQPICLPEKVTSLQEKRMCTISGWGSIKSGVSTPSNILRAAQIPIINDEICKQAHVYGAAVTSNMFCAGYMDKNADACDGDSGGPLVCSDEDGDTLYGIISWGQHCGYINKPGVYVKVDQYIDWIYDKINLSLHKS